MEPNQNNTPNRTSNMSMPRPIREPGSMNSTTALYGDDMNKKTETPANASNDVVFQDKPKKKSHAMVIGMVLLVILAAGGIGFGVWAMLDGNSRVAKKDSQISELNSQISSLQQEKSELSDKVAELEKSNEEAQENIAKDEEKIKEDEAQIAEDQQAAAEGYQVKSIGACVLDTGTAEGGSTVLKCDAVTSLGNGKFVYDSQSGKLRFVILQ